MKDDKTAANIFLEQLRNLPPPADVPTDTSTQISHVTITRPVRCNIFIGCRPIQPRSGSQS